MVGSRFKTVDLKFYGTKESESSNADTPGLFLYQGVTLGAIRRLWKLNFYSGSGKSKTPELE